MTNQCLVESFVRFAKANPSSTALEVSDKTLTYGELQKAVSQLAGVIHQAKANDCVGILASHSITAYTGIVATHYCGKAYVPMHAQSPETRNLYILDLLKINTLFVDTAGLTALEKLLPQVKNTLCVIAPEIASLSDIQGRFPEHKFFTTSQIDAMPLALPVKGAASALAYVLFTSGSTGNPKSVGITFNNLRSFVEAINESSRLGPSDRFSQVHELTFDLSVMSIFASLANGACICAMSKSDLLFPANFIKNKRPTVWLSTPSLAVQIDKMRALQPNAFGSLRLSIFCGEPLSAAIAEKWQAATPNGVVENHYGPTETTVIVTRYQWNQKLSNLETRKGIVPIGRVIPGSKVMLRDTRDRTEIIGEGTGELYIGGNQIAPGYHLDEKRSAESFVKFPETRDELWYKTGDLVYRDRNGHLHFIERLDLQVKILGYRVELTEIEGAIKSIVGTEAVVAFPLRGTDDRVIGIAVAIEANSDFDELEIIKACKEKLPYYMVPKHIYAFAKFPLNTSFKTDRKAIANFAHLKKTS